ncbi:HAD family hydrolase [Peteryoungia desertarenae]|uniref:HAD family hydrolase n=1 Tax=Peteryoungia desertarenae TaxID=1813451 RepID=A0ABX6QRJ1_9HYPH|nr:HAD family hydrolase [Peteryoungia desertarenae]QLF71150.1 HAD family hydrolase [Peteryoungia desertarenae]
MKPRAKRLVIFDCDGVLVDSEVIALEVLVWALQEKGIALDIDGASARFLGRSLGSMAKVVQDEFGVAIDDDFLNRMRDELYSRFRRELRPVRGIEDALQDLAKQGIDWCVASSSQRERIELSLSVTGLLAHFSPHIFSATMVENGKPAPDLFLHAASSMGIEPKNCMVVEDSPAGISAAKAAGMKVLAFTGGSHTTSPAYGDALDALHPDHRFDAMGELLQFVQK